MNRWRKTCKLYGITLRQLKEVRAWLLECQENKCAICERDMAGKRAFLDHDHRTGELRGLLDLQCNRFLVAKNNPETIAKVVDYLLDPPAKHVLKAALEAVK